MTKNEIIDKYQKMANKNPEQTLAFCIACSNEIDNPVEVEECRVCKDFSAHIWKCEDCGKFKDNNDKFVSKELQELLEQQDRMKEAE